MENQICRKCKYFRQHYGLDGTKIFRLHCGHCVLPKMRVKKPDQKACARFVQGDDPEKKFVSKKYLSKTLLDWIRQLEFLPEIQDENAP
ncbi:MAG: hypothetical protein IJD63_01995 [Oscillospiraceae bacterium]|nr:hypothetical protein [Oscillospiraceae bacterium]